MGKASRKRGIESPIANYSAWVQGRDDSEKEPCPEADCENQEEYVLQYTVGDEIGDKQYPRDDNTPGICLSRESRNLEYDVNAERHEQCRDQKKYVARYLEPRMMLQQYAGGV